MSRFRALVTAADATARQAATAAFQDAGCEVLTCDGGGCVERVRAERPDLLVLVPPLLWGSVAGALAALSEDATTRHIPVLILGPAVGDGPFPQVPRLFLRDRRDPEPALRGRVDRAHARMRKWARQDLFPAADWPVP